MEFNPELQPVRRIHSEDLHRGTPHWCQPDHQCAAQFEMPIPILLAGIEQLGDLATLWIDAGKIGAFMQVAVVTGQRQVSRVVAASMLPGNDMIDVKKREGAMLLFEMAVFTTVRSTGLHQPALRRIHH